LGEIYPLVKQHSYGKSPSFIGKSTINGYKWAIFYSYVSLPEGSLNQTISQVQWQLIGSTLSLKRLVGAINDILPSPPDLPRLEKAAEDVLII
jgi:hypothetical protein